jgi:EmrB/QacA subfamily drug resistance transporter
LKIAPKWQVLAIVCLGIFMATLDGSILNIANPTIARDLGVDLQQIQWVVTAYMLTVTATLLFLGKLGDRIGSHRIYTAGFLGFTLGSLFCGMSSTLYGLTAARVFQAVGASMLMATGMGIVSNSFPQEERGKALGLTGSVVGIGNMTGPALGGFLVAHFAWPVIFWINIPIGVIAFCLAWRYLPQQEHSPGESGFDPIGIILFALAAVILVLSLSVSGGIEWRLFLLGMILLLGFYGFEKRNPRALLDLTLFKVKSFLFGNVMGFITYIVQTFMFFLLPFYLERVLGYSPDQSGLFMTIPTICLTITAPLAGSLSDRIGPARLTSISYFLVSIAFIVFSLMDIASSPWHIAAGLVTFGIGMGCFGSPNNSSILGSVPKTKAGYAGGFIATIRNFGNALGIALSASLLTWLLSKNLLSLPYKQAYVLASHHTYLFAAGLSLTGLLISLMTASQRDTTQQRVSRQDA